MSMASYTEEPNNLPQIDEELVQQCGWCDATTLMATFSPQVSPLPRQMASLHSLTAGRSWNEDYGLAFALTDPTRPWVVMAVADGLGGHPGGRAASHLACRGVITAASSSQAHSPEDFIAELQAGATQTVAEFASRAPEDYCLTTLIIVVATSQSYFLAWIGDGGVRIRRSDGHWLKAMEPHRGSSGLSFDVGGCLGAVIRGEWETAVVERLTGDLLAVGSDGVMEPVTDFESFFQAPLTHHRQNMDLQASMGAWLDECVRAHPDYFEDNLTLAVLMTP